MTAESHAPRPTLRVVKEAAVPATYPGLGTSQRVLLGAPPGDGSPMLLGITRVAPGCTTALIEHDTAEVAYVVAGEGLMLTDEGQHAFGPGSAVLIEARCWHAIRAGIAEVTMIFVFPSPSVPATRQWPA